MKVRRMFCLSVGICASGTYFLLSLSLTDHGENDAALETGISGNTGLTAQRALRDFMQPGVLSSEDVLAAAARGASIEEFLGSPPSKLTTTKDSDNMSGDTQAAVFLGSLRGAASGNAAAARLASLAPGVQGLTHGGPKKESLNLAASASPGQTAAQTEPVLSPLPPGRGGRNTTEGNTADAAAAARRAQMEQWEKARLKHKAALDAVLSFAGERKPVMQAERTARAAAASIMVRLR